MTLALLAAFAVMVMRVVLHQMGNPADGTDFMLIHFLAIVTIVYFSGHRMLQHYPASGFPDLLREGFRNALVYALFVCIFLWVYYAQLESDIFTRKIDERVALGVAEGQPEALIRERMERFFTPFNYATITFFALLAVSAFQAFALGLLHHKVMRRFTR